MAQLRQDYREFTDRNTEIIAIGPEDKEAFAVWWREHEMPFIGIGDPQHRIAKMYGQKVNLLKLGRMPASMILDMNGKIRWMHYGESMSDIPENSEILTILEELNKETG